MKWKRLEHMSNEQTLLIKNQIKISYLHIPILAKQKLFNQYKRLITYSNTEAIAWYRAFFSRKRIFFKSFFITNWRISLTLESNWSFCLFLFRKMVIYLLFSLHFFFYFIDNFSLEKQKLGLVTEATLKLHYIFMLF